MRVGQIRRRDDAEGPIVAALEAIGKLCQRISAPGFADVVVYDPQNRRLRLLEIKSRVGQLTPAQRDVHVRWPIDVVRDVSSALALFGVVG